MNAEVFLDTNILLYACSADPADTGKQARASSLILETRFALSAQVLQEFIANALKKKSLGIGDQAMEATLELAGHVPVLPVSLELVLYAVTLRRRHTISQWDATILAAAIELGCHTPYTEDLNHGQVYDGVRVLNPFLDGASWTTG